MFLLMLSIPLLLLSLIWHKFNYNSKVLLNFLIISIISFFYTSYYLNGEDWSVYYLKFKNDSELYTSFEFGFVLFFKSLLLLGGNNFGVAIFIFFIICFCFLIYILWVYEANIPLFIALLILVFGNNLILEQLRQLIATIILFYGILKYNKNGSLKKFIFWVFIASSMHISSLIILPAVILSRIKRNRSFTLITLFSVSVLFLLLIAASAFFGSIAHLNFAFDKIYYYLQKNSISFSLGWLNVLDVVFIALYLIYRKQIDVLTEIKFLTRLVFIGLVIHLFSGSLNFLSRVTFVFYFIGIYLFCQMPNHSSERYLNIKSYSTLIFSVLFMVLVSFNYISYFRNVQSPVRFDNVNISINDILKMEYVDRLAIEKFQNSLSNVGGRDGK